MARGSKLETPQDQRENAKVAQLLLKEIVDAEHIAVVGLPASVHSFVADMRRMDIPCIPDLAEFGVLFINSDDSQEGTSNDLLERVRDVLRKWQAPIEVGAFAVSDLAEVGVANAIPSTLAAYATDPKRALEAVAISGSAEAGDDGWGPVVATVEAEALERENLRLQVDQRREQVANSFTRSEAADLLGVSPQTVSDMVAERRLVGLKEGREWRLPTWQFTPDLEEPVLPEIGRLALEFPGGAVSLSRWMGRPNDNFGGRTPAKEMTRDRDHVHTVVRSLTAA